MLDVEVLDWCGYTWSAVGRPVGCTAKFSETPLETAYGGEMNIQFTGNSFGWHSCSPSKLATSVALCCVIKLHILEWPFIVASLRHTCMHVGYTVQLKPYSLKWLLMLNARMKTESKQHWNKSLCEESCVHYYSNSRLDCSIPLLLRKTNQKYPLMQTTWLSQQYN